MNTNQLEELAGIAAINIPAYGGKIRQGERVRVTELGDRSYQVTAGERHAVMPHSEMLIAVEPE